MRREGKEQAALLRALKWAKRVANEHKYGESIARIIGDRIRREKAKGKKP